MKNFPIEVVELIAQFLDWKDFLLNYSIRLELENEFMYLMNFFKVENSHLKLCCECGSLNIARMLLFLGDLDPSYNDFIALKTALYYGNFDIFKLLISDVRSYSENILFWASQFNTENTVKSLKFILNNPQVDPSAKDNRAIRWASYYDNSHGLKSLMMEESVDPSAWVNRAIKSTENPCIIQLLISDYRVDIKLNRDNPKRLNL
ncbi:hypothetical protein HDU92_008803 [Lobulomyces angularis]|nr:hypothetical protein HDU92_008803 [Lobulomyces angularis]